MPAAEVDVTAELVSALLHEQHPDLADREPVVFANGWDNVMLRLGEGLIVRVPRRELAARLVDHELACLPALAPRLPIAIPAPVRAGSPSERLGYPWSWSIIPWIDGEIAARSELVSPFDEAERLAAFVAALHVEAPGPVAADVPDNPYRGHFIGRNDPVLRERLAGLGDAGLAVGGVTIDRIIRRWEELVDVEPFTDAPVWLHGDLHTLNVLVDDGAICGVIDFGDICAGDPATDLAIAWMLFDDEARAVFRTSAGPSRTRLDDATWQRGEAWALYFAVMYLAFSADHPDLRVVGETLLGRLFA